MVPEGQTNHCRPFTPVTIEVGLGVVGMLMKRVPAKVCFEPGGSGNALLEGDVGATLKASSVGLTLRSMKRLTDEFCTDVARMRTVEVPEAEK